MSSACKNGATKAKALQNVAFHRAHNWLLVLQCRLSLIVFFLSLQATTDAVSDVKKETSHKSLSKAATDD